MTNPCNPVLFGSYFCPVFLEQAVTTHVTWGGDAWGGSEISFTVTEFGVNWWCKLGLTVVALVCQSRADGDSSVMMLLEAQGRRSCPLACTVQSGWFYLCEGVLESRWTGVSGEDNVNQADFGLAGRKQVSSEMLAVLRPLNIICFVLKD